MLVLATVAAIAITNSPLGLEFEALWRQELGLSLGDAAFRRSILHWVNDGLLTVFFLVVGLEVKREMTVGHLASRRSAALPIAATVARTSKMPAEGPQLAKSRAAVRTRCPSVPSIASTRELSSQGPS